MPENLHKHQTSHGSNRIYWVMQGKQVLHKFYKFYKKPKISTTLGSASIGFLEVHFHSANLIAFLTMQLASAAQRRYICVR